MESLFPLLSMIIFLPALGALLAFLIGSEDLVKRMALLTATLTFLLAVIAFALELLPILGPWLSAIPAIALALSESVELAITVAVFYLVLQQVESNVILPMVQRHQTEMPALVVLSAVLLGGAAMGILGALVALPLAVIVHTIATEVLIPWGQARVAGAAPRA